MYKIILSATLSLFLAPGFAQSTDEIYGNARLLNQEDDGYRGIWYMISAPDSEYKLKYGGGLGTYPANHYPFSVYVAEVNKTFFCYGGTDETNSTLYHQVSYSDHASGRVAGSVYTWGNRLRIVASTTVGPQPYNTGGEVVIWESKNKGKTWKRKKQITQNSEFNHSYMRRPVNVHPGFYAFWADGHGREKSKSRLYFCDIHGNVYQLPEKMEGEFGLPVLIEESP